MKPSSWRSHAVTLCVLAFGGTLGLMAACGAAAATVGAKGGLPPAAVRNAVLIKGIKQNARISALVPAMWRQKSQVLVATNANYAPDQFLASNGTIVGWNPDLGSAIGKVLGLRLRFVNVASDEFIPGLLAHKFDLTMAGENVTPEREKAVNFVTYFKAGMSFLVRKGSSVHPKSLGDLCGLKVAAEKASVEMIAAQQQSTVCQKAGKGPIALSVFEDENAVNLALISERVQVAFSDSPVIAYQVELFPDTLQQSGGIYSAEPEGIQILPGNAAMERALQGAVNSLIADGMYRKLLANWRVQGGAIARSELMPAVSPK